MNNGELWVKIKTLSHRRDLDEQIQAFINECTTRLNRRFGLNYSNMLHEPDTNHILANFPDIYIYGSMRQLSLHIHDFDEAREWDQLYVAEVSRQNITTTTETWPLDPVVIQSEKEVAASGN